MAAGEYRYVLHRDWVEVGPTVRAVWVMLNPSTADDRRDDPTLRRCVAFSRRLGCSGLSVVNLYALRSRHPRRLWQHPDPVGPDNDHRIAGQLAVAAAEDWPVVCAWGAGARPDRAAEVLTGVLRAGLTPLVLGVTRDGHPRHPLYLAGATELRPWCP